MRCSTSKQPSIRACIRVCYASARCVQEMAVLRAFAFASTIVWVGSVAGLEGRFTLEFTSSESVLEYFANCALLVDRGLAISPFDCSADAQMLMFLRKSRQFQQELGLSRKFLTAIEQASSQLEDATSYDSEDADISVADGVICDCYDSKDLRIRAWLNDNLNATQKERLAELYLNREGLLALRRLWFRDHVGLSVREQEQIAALGTSRINDDKDGTRQLHGGIFALQNKDLHLLPQYRMELRQQSAALDREILRMLSVKQKERLANITCRAMNAMSIQDVKDRDKSIECRLANAKGD